MFRMWVKIKKDNHLLADTVIEDASDATRTKKVLTGLEEACRRFDLSVPIWLNANIKEFQRIAKTRFRADSFIETIDFDYLEIHMIEED
ncbi:MAG: hypothetical protein J5865_03640 [Lachnospiraceae bacterium]|nr:hypothetical protein [Lachnospiraceae bacterium]